jgi:hypothetical protein
MQSLTVDIPEPVFLALKRIADDAQRSVQEVAQEVITAHVRLDDGLPPGTADELAKMPPMTDAELWSTAQTRVPAEQAARLEDLHYRKVAGSMTAEDCRQQRELLAASNRVMLIRAQAAALLKARGHDVSVLLKP